MKKASSSLITTTTRSLFGILEESKEERAKRELIFQLKVLCLKFEALILKSITAWCLRIFVIHFDNK